MEAGGLAMPDWLLIMRPQGAVAQLLCWTHKYECSDGRTERQTDRQTDSRRWLFGSCWAGQDVVLSQLAWRAAGGSRLVAVEDIFTVEIWKLAGNLIPFSCPFSLAQSKTKSGFVLKYANSKLFHLVTRTLLHPREFSLSASLAGQPVSAACLAGLAVLMVLLVVVVEKQFNLKCGRADGWSLSLSLSRALSGVI